MILYRLRDMVKEILNNTGTEPSHVRVGAHLYDVMSKQFFGENKGIKFNFDSIDIVCDTTLGDCDMVMGDKYAPVLLKEKDYRDRIQELETEIVFLETRLSNIRELTDTDDR